MDIIQSKIAWTSVTQPVVARLQLIRTLNFPDYIELELTFQL